MPPFKFTHQSTSARPPHTDEGRDLVTVSTSSLVGLSAEAKTIHLKPARVLSRMAGNYLSTFKGRGMEFDESRPYQAGDDVRNLDWRVTARTGRAYTKQFREERERAVLVWTDLRPSMFFATQGAFKAVQAAHAAALLAWSAVAHGDRLGGLFFSQQQHQELRPQRGKKAVMRFIRQLANHDAWQPDHADRAQLASSSTEAISRLRRVARPGSLVFLISDFYHLEPRFEDHLAQLARHNDLVMISLYDTLEQDLPPDGRYRLFNGQETISIHTGDPKQRSQHQDRFHSHQQYLQRLSRLHRIHLISCRTDDDVVERLRSGLRLKRR